VERRERLVAQAQEQRRELSLYHQQFEAPVRAAEAVFGLFHSLRHSPLFVTGLAIALVRTPWRKLARIPKWAWRGWRVFQFMRNWAG